MTDSRKRFLAYQFPAIAWAAAIFISSSIPSSSIPNIGLFSIDKIVHAILFFILTLMAYRAFLHQDRFPRLAANPHWMAFVVAVAYAVTDELHQVFVPGRVPEWGDLVADASGAFLFLLLLALKRARAPSGTPPGN